MDNWGDPWADNADNAKSPTKSKVTSPLAPTFAPAPTLLNGFLDDAGWGNDDESFGDWSSVPTKQIDEPAPGYTVPESFATPKLESPSVDAPWHVEEDLSPQVVHEKDDWAGVTLDTQREEDKVVSEPSDSSTTVQADEIAEDEAKQASAQTTPDDDSSIRTSTSPSETDHVDATTDSPRTSYEEERGDVKATRSEEEQTASDQSRPTRTEVDETISPSIKDEQDEEILKDGPHTQKDSDHATNVQSSDEESIEPPENVNNFHDDAPAVSSRADIDTSLRVNTFAVDSVSLHELFPPQKEAEDLGEAPDDPICSTSTRKAWYRLTRRQTMREYKNGNDDDNYIRVTWADSHIRSEVNKVVGRWAREDRLSGKGPGARASFYWDTPAPIESMAGGFHNRQQSSYSVTNPAPPLQQSLPAVSTAATAAFDWSSPSTSANPWHQGNPSLRSTSSPIAPINPAVSKLQRQEGRSVSVDLTSHKPGPSNHARSQTATGETLAAASLISPSISDTIASSFDPWNNTKDFKVDPIPKESPLVTAPVDDDEDWGDMVSSPTVPSPTPIDLIAQPDTPSDTKPSRATTPQPIRTVAIQDQSPDAMHAAPIVRLRTTISPTSAIFKANSFIPLHVEQGPIGPGILKPNKRSVSATTKKAVETPSPSLSNEQVQVAVGGLGDSAKPDSSSDLFAQQNSTLDISTDTNQENKTSPAPTTPIVPNISRPSTPPPPIAAPLQSNVDSWADADFSFFESSAPATPPRTQRDPSDPFSAFESPPRSTSAASSAKPFTRSPPRKVTPPPIQPLTSATSSAQRRKTEEDGVIQEILNGLPDLSYMLR